MPFRLPFNIPFFNSYRPSYYNPSNQDAKSNNNLNNRQSIPSIHSQSFLSAGQFQDNAYKKDSEKSIESSESFFEIFGLKLYFDDILIICILFFLYNEKVHDDELFICLILLLFS